jgi:hypothetical protein
MGREQAFGREKGDVLMLRFCGFDLELVVKDVLSRQDGPAVCTARDGCDGQWLIVQIQDEPGRLAWLCAPMSERAGLAVMDGRAAPLDVVRHSATGTVELVAVDQGRAIPDRCLLCSEVDEHLRASDRRRSVQAA